MEIEISTGLKICSAGAMSQGMICREANVGTANKMLHSQHGWAIFA
jgi:hypothetical protein